MNSMNKCARSCKKIDECGSMDLADLLSTGDEDTKEVIKGLWENDKRNVKREFQRDQRTNGTLYYGAYACMYSMMTLSTGI